MRIDILLRANCAADSIRFYVDELGMFEIAADYGMDSYLLRSTTNPGICLQLTTWHPEKQGKEMFGLSVPSCTSMFERLRKIQFSNGAGIVPNKRGDLEVFDWPGGKSFALQDPSGNRFLLFEDYIASDE